MPWRCFQDFTVFACENEPNTGIKYKLRGLPVITNAFFW
jgi:hypothetical protein